MSSTVRAAAAAAAAAERQTLGRTVTPAAVTWPVTGTPLFPRPGVGLEMWDEAREKEVGRVKGVLMKHFRGRQKVSDAQKV